MFIINQTLKADKIPAGKGEELFKQHIAWFTKHFEQGDFPVGGALYGQRDGRDYDCRHGQP